MAVVKVYGYYDKVSRTVAVAGKMKHNWIGLLLLVTMLGCSAKTISSVPESNLPEDNAIAKTIVQPIVESYILEDAREFNQQLVTELTGADVSIWQVQPLSLTLRYLQGIPGTSHIKQEIPEGENSEFPSKVLVTVIRDGYQDDSLRGEWSELTWQRNSSEIWQISTAKRAFKCYRGTNTTNFQQDFCP